MSYNKIKVSSKTPNSTGDIALNVNDISSVSSPNDSEVLTYNNGWVAESSKFLKDHDRALNSVNELASASNENDVTMLLSETFLPSGKQRWMSWHKETESVGDYTNFTANASNDVELLVMTFPTTKIFYGFKFNNAGVYRVFFKFALNAIYGDDIDSVDIQLSNNDNSVTYSPRVRIKRPNMNQPALVGVVNASANQEVGMYRHAVTDSPKKPFGLFRDFLLIIEKIG